MFAPLLPECIVPFPSRSGDLLGLFVLGPRLSDEPYSSEDKMLLRSVASQAGVTLENLNLAKTSPNACSRKEPFRRKWKSPGKCSGSCSLKGFRT
jgi:sigma-B regulation protein RsbU (phosphoserine phosphatase)